jgi:hypothetical protein
MRNNVTHTTLPQYVNISTIPHPAFRIWRRKLQIARHLGIFEKTFRTLPLQTIVKLKRNIR